MQKRSERIKAAREDQRFSLTKQLRQEATKGIVAATLAIGMGGYLTQASQILADEIATTTKRYHQNDFINQLAKPAMEIAKKNDLYSSVMIAQAALESGWGQSQLAKAPNHNLFGIKGAYQGQSVHYNTLEDAGGQNYYTINAGFRKYPNYDASLQDYANLLTGNHDPQNWRYNFYKGARRSQTATYQDATKWLTGRYATDNGYAGKLNSIIEANQLTQFDGEYDGKVIGTVNNRSNVSTQAVTSGAVVKAGDGFYAIAKRYGVTVTDLLAANGMSINTMIHPGQVLKLPTIKAPVQSGTKKDTPVKGKPEVKEVSKVEKQQEVKLQTSSRVAVVKAGDGFYAIAKRYGVSVNDLLRANGMNLNTVIHPNQTLKLPGQTTSTQTVASQTTTKTEVKPDQTPQVQSRVAVVKAGDGFYAIAKRYGVSVNDLLRANGMNLNTVIHPNQTLKLPGQVTVAQSEAPKATTKTNKTQETVAQATPQVQQVVNQQQANGAVVKAGDGFYAVASRYGVSVQDLLAVNGMNLKTVIHPGQVLKLPGQKATTSVSLPKTGGSSSAATQQPKDVQPSSVASQAPVVNVNATNKTVVVQAGQGLWRIAYNNGMSLDELKALNGLTSNMIHPGQVLKVK